MKPKQIICVVCPLGCGMQVSPNGSGWVVEGNQCAKGKQYAIDEMTNPMRTLTTTVTLTGAGITRLPVRTDKPFPKNRIADLMKELKKIKVSTPVKAGQILLENVFDTDVNVVSSRTVA